MHNWIFERFAYVNMHLCDSLIWEVQELMGKIDRVGVKYR